MPTVRAGDLPYTGVNSEVPSPQVPSAYQSIRATPEDFGAGIGTALSQLGSTIERGASQFAENAIARQQLENQVRADDQTNKYQETVTKILHGDPDIPGDTGFFGKRGEDAMRAFPQVSKDINDLRNTMRSQLANDRQRLSFDNESRRYAALAASRMGDHYDREFKNYGTAVNTAGATNAMAGAATALANGDQAEFERQLGENMKFKLKQAELAGTAGNAEVVNSILASTREDAVKMKFLKLSETNPYAAKQFLDANTDALKPGEAHSLFKSIEPQWRKMQAAIDNGEMQAPQGWNEPPRRGAINTADPVEHFLGLAELHESRGRNILQNVVGPQGGYNPSVGRVTGPSSAQGYFQITNTTWQEFAPGAGVDTGKYPNALSAPYEVQKAVARNIVTTSGVQHWTNYNSNLRQAVAFAGLPTSGPIRGGTGAAPSTAGAPARQSATPLKVDYAFGDSNGQLATNHGVPGQVGTDVVVGENPEQIYGRMQARGKEFFTGKIPILASGTNDPTQVEFIEKSAAFLREAGVKGMVIPGVGPKVPGGQAAADVLNAQLQGIAQKYGGTFVMPDNWQKDGYHIANVPKFLDKANAALGAGSAETPAPAAAPAPTVTGRGAPLTPAQLREGTSGSSAAAEILMADAGGADTVEKKAPIPGMKLAPIPPPDPGELPDAQIPGLTEKIADLASQPWAKENPTRLLDAIKYARTQANAKWVESQRDLKLHQEQAKASSDAQQRKYFERFATESVPESEILKDKALLGPAIENTINFQRSLARGGDPDAAVDRDNWAKLVGRITAPYGTPDKITTIDPIVKAATDKQIGRASMHDLMTMVDKQKNEYGTTTQALKDKFVGLFKPLVEGPENMSAGDPLREVRYANFVLAVDKLVADNGKAGKDPSALFTRTDPNDQFSSPIGKIAKEYAAPFRASMMPPPPGTPKEYKTPEEVKAEVGKTLTYDQAVDILSTKFGKPKTPSVPVAPAYTGP